jgi:peptide chain release factor 2
MIETQSHPRPHRRPQPTARNRYGGIFDYDAKPNVWKKSAASWKTPISGMILNARRRWARSVRPCSSKTVNGIREPEAGASTTPVNCSTSANGRTTKQPLLAVDADTTAIAAKVEKLEFQRMFSGKMDGANAFVDIQAGAGGTEAQDWAEMLLRMYLRWAEDKGWKTELMEASGRRSGGHQERHLQG